MNLLLMLRAHALPFAKDIIFIDTTSSCDLESHTITFLMTPCTIGAVPLGIIITKGQTTNDYHHGLKLIMENIENAFCANSFPKIVMSDDSAAILAAVKKIWPSSQSLLCDFHICQRIWRWLSYKDNNIVKNDRHLLYKMFPAVMYEQSKEAADKAYQWLISLQIPLGMKYLVWIEYLKRLKNEEENWLSPDAKRNGAIKLYLAKFEHWLDDNFIDEEDKNYFSILHKDIIMSISSDESNRAFNDATSYFLPQKYPLWIKYVATSSK